MQGPLSNLVPAGWKARMVALFNRMLLHKSGYMHSRYA